MENKKTSATATPKPATGTFKQQSCDRCRLKKIKCSFISSKKLQRKLTSNGSDASLSNNSLFTKDTPNSYPTVERMGDSATTLEKKFHSSNSETHDDENNGSHPPQCEQCAAVGFECKVTDKLSRKSFPRGYTETLEQRVRELETENLRLSSLCKVNQLHNSNDHHPRNTTAISQKNSSTGARFNNTAEQGGLADKRLNNSGNTTSQNGKLFDHCPDAKEEMESHENSKLHEVPVGASNSSYDPTAISFEPLVAPGLPAAKTLTHISQHEKSVQLTILVALSVPRSTEEVLFTPQLLAKIGKCFGLSSKHCLYTASLLASLKENFELPISLTGIPIANENLWDIDNIHDFFVQVLKLQIVDSNLENGTSNKTRSSSSSSSSSSLYPPLLSIQKIRKYCQYYFDEWASVVPIMNKQDFFQHLDKFEKDICLFDASDKRQEYLNNLPRATTLSYKIFASILVVVVQMGIMSAIKQKNNVSKNGSQKATFSDNSANLKNLLNLSQHYNIVLKQLVENPYFNARTTSIPSLQFLTIALQYFTNIGDSLMVYDLKGKVCLMSQQLRLHRCPSVVLGVNGSKLNSIQQSDRRLLFWANYVLDCFSSYQLGIPRIFKDQDIECALPFSSDSLSHGETFQSDDPLSSQEIQTSISSFSVNIIRFSKVLGNVLDTIYKRHMSVDAKKTTMAHEQALDSWRQKLPQHLTFGIDVNGNINLDDIGGSKIPSGGQFNSGTAISKEKLTLMILYCLCKCVIHLPVVAIKKLDPAVPHFKGSSSSSSFSSSSSLSYMILQQSSSTLLNLLCRFKATYFTLPLTYSSLVVHFSLISIRQALEFHKSGILFQEIKTVIMDLTADLLKDRKNGVPGSLSWYSMKLHDICMQMLLYPTKESKTDNEKLEKMLEKVTAMYDGLMGKHGSLYDTNNNNQKLSTSKKRKSDQLTSHDVDSKHEQSNSILVKRESENDSPPFFPKASSQANHLKKLRKEVDIEEEDEDDDGIMMKPIRKSSGGSLSSSRTPNFAQRSSAPVEQITSSALPEPRAVTVENAKLNNKWVTNVNAINEAFQVDPVLSMTDLYDYFTNKQQLNNLANSLNPNDPNISNNALFQRNKENHDLGPTTTIRSGFALQNPKIPFDSNSNRYHNNEAQHWQPPSSAETSYLKNNYLLSKKDKFSDKRVVEAGRNANSFDLDANLPTNESFLNSLKDVLKPGDPLNSRAGSTINGLFNVPSNGNFLKEFMRPSLANLNEMLNFEHPTKGKSSGVPLDQKPSSVANQTGSSNNGNVDLINKNKSLMSITSFLNHPEGSDEKILKYNENNLGTQSNQDVDNNTQGIDSGINSIKHSAQNFLNEFSFHENSNVFGNAFSNASMNNLFTVDASLGLAPLLEFSNDFITPPPTIPAASEYVSRPRNAGNVSSTTSTGDNTYVPPTNSGTFYNPTFGSNLKTELLNSQAKPKRKRQSRVNKEPKGKGVGK